MNNSLMIELYVTQNNKKIEHWKDDSVYLLNDAKHILKVIPQENSMGDDNKMDEKVNIVDKQKYEQDFSEFKKFCTFIKIAIGRNITVPSEK